MKPELRKALEAELDRLNARVDAIRLLLETAERGSTVSAQETETVPAMKSTDGRSLRWQNASPEQRKRWAAAIRAGKKRHKRNGK